MKNIAIIGAGAAGCFCAQRLKELRPEAKVTVFESHSKPLAKVSVTGGGRCNLTNSFALVRDLREVYPRGHQLMKRLFHVWNHWDTMSWFEEHGVRLVTQEDECVFPVSQNAMEIVEVLRRGLDLRLQTRVAAIEKREDGKWEVFAEEQGSVGVFDAVVVTTGGARRFSWLARLGIEIVPPVPSLFPFKLEPAGLEKMSGAVVKDAELVLPGAKCRARGTVLVTHNGISGPATLRLSSYAARFLAENACCADLVINWMGELGEEQVREALRDFAQSHPNKLVIGTVPAFDGDAAERVLTSRMWEFMVARAGIHPQTRWSGMGKKQYNKLVTVLTADTHKVTGRVPHKEEFVTAGGVSLAALDGTTLESKTQKGLFFAGEVTDVDGVTGGFNLQAAWTMAEVVARAVKG